MKILRDYWRRSAYCEFLANLEPIDRVTFCLVIPLGITFALCVDAVSHP
jgi:hypothetical protein